MDKKWTKILKQLDEQYPDVERNDFKFRYVHTDTYLYDINRKDLHDLSKDEDEGDEGDDDKLEQKRSHDIELGTLMMKKLKGKQRSIVYKKYFEEKSLAQIGRELKMSRQLVHYHLNKALQILRENFT